MQAPPRPVASSSSSSGAPGSPSSSASAAAPRSWGKRLCCEIANTSTMTMTTKGTASRRGFEESGRKPATRAWRLSSCRKSFASRRWRASRRVDQQGMERRPRARRRSSPGWRSSSSRGRGSLLALALAACWITSSARSCSPNSIPATLEISTTRVLAQRRRWRLLGRRTRRRRRRRRGGARAKQETQTMICIQRGRSMGLRKEMEKETKK
mmetsp:Transcript_52690/g.112432  ORF Transcript_52690/g.112432 Transcript_52690/m.112432 type:complete len:211 (+) Transcript_52690:224-856(+)